MASDDLVTGLNVSAASLGISSAMRNNGTITHVNVSGGTDAISLTAPSGTYTITDVNLTPGGAGLVLASSSATVNASALTIATTTGKGIVGNGGTLNVSGASSVTSTAGTAIDLTSMVLGATFT